MNATCTIFGAAGSDIEIECVGAFIIIGAQMIIKEDEAAGSLAFQQLIDKECLCIECISPSISMPAPAKAGE